MDIVPSRDGGSTGRLRGTNKHIQLDQHEGKRDY